MFALLADTDGWTRWMTFDEAALSKPGDHDPEGVGAERRFRKGRTRSHERVVDFAPPNHFGYVLLSGMPLRKYRADVRVTPTATGSAITWDSAFETSFPTPGRFYRMALQRFIDDTISRLARAAERR